ncbi:abscission/NoCut checkpoint regulator-like [Anneissia japonica]|uniref:abscission/NoCut checkpoint regulator-like n=1 Tax=Anneissia japonica TaxID=1529436 RepID=UPI00142583AA|nr:abscission/NoCut checkpoint regulator-like [Anneissia japonica]
MSCYSCTENFGVFRREHSCKRCHFSFCSKCLPHKAVLHANGSKAQPVCRSCYKILTTTPKPDEQNNANHARYSPPENFKRRMEALAAKESTDNQPAPLPPSLSKGNANSNQYRGLQPKDRNLVERLNKLKEDRKKQQGKIPSTEEMEERLRVLRGLSKPSDNPSVSQASKPYFPPDKRNMEEQFQDLMDEMSAEVELEGSSEKKDGNIVTNPGARTSNNEGNLFDNSKDFQDDVKNLMKEGSGKAADNDNDLQEDVKRLLKESEEELKRAKQQEEEDANLAAKLASIQGLDPEKARMDFKSKGVFHDTSSDEDEELATKQLLQQLAEEQRLNEKVKASGNEDILNQAEQSIKEKEPPTKGYVVDPDELPWCCICNEDAALRCLGCEGDLYCKRCFKEGHDEFGETHEIEQYKKPKNRDK